MKIHGVVQNSKDFDCSWLDYSIDDYVSTSPASTGYVETVDTWAKVLSL